MLSKNKTVAIALRGGWFVGATLLLGWLVLSTWAYGDILHLERRATLKKHSQGKLIRLVIKAETKIERLERKIVRLKKWRSFAGIVIFICITVILFSFFWKVFIPLFRLLKSIFFK